MALVLGKAHALIGINTLGMQKGLKTAQAQFATGIAAMNKIGAKVKLGLAIGAGGLGLAVKQAASFEQGMARVKAITGETGETFDALTAKAMELGRTTMFSARQSADAMSAFALAGFDAQKIMGAMPATLDLAAAGQLDVAQAADITAKVMAGMGLEASEVTHAIDVLAKAMTTANTDMVQLGEGLKFVGPAAKSTGKSLEETTALLQVLSNAGLQASMGGTILKTVFGRMSGGTKEVNDVFGELGVSTLTVGGSIRNMADIVDDLNAAMKGKGGAEKFALMLKAFGQRGVLGMVELLAQGGDEIRRFQSQLENAGGTAKRIAEVQMNTLQGKLTILKSAVEGLGIAVGNQLLPALSKITRKVTRFVAALGSAEGASIRATLATAAWYAKLGLVVLILPKVMAAMMLLMKGVTAMMAAGGLGGMLALLNPLTIAFAALAVGLAVAGEAFAEAKIRGKTFGEVLAENLGFLRETNKELDRLMADRPKKGAAAISDIADDEAFDLIQKEAKTKAGISAPLQKQKTEAIARRNVLQAELAGFDVAHPDAKPIAGASTALSRERAAMQRKLDAANVGVGKITAVADPAMHQARIARNRAAAAMAKRHDRNVKEVAALQLELGGGGPKTPEEVMLDRIEALQDATRKGQDRRQAGNIRRAVGNVLPRFGEKGGAISKVQRAGPGTSALFAGIGAIAKGQGGDILKGMMGAFRQLAQGGQEGALRATAELMVGERKQIGPAKFSGVTEFNKSVQMQLKGQESEEAHRKRVDAKMKELARDLKDGVKAIKALNLGLA